MLSANESTTTKPLRTARKLAALACVVPLTLAAASGCSVYKKGEGPNETTAAETATTESPRETTESKESAGSSTTGTTAASSSTTKSAMSGTKIGKKDVAEVMETFGTLAPPEFFAMFDSCEPNGVPDSKACSGPEVGQFQFFKGDAKAASTTQLLTELRSSRVVEDSGDRVVGWSTLGTTAVITVVDNARGLTMQQMVSSDKQDPLERILKLGLSKKAQTSSSTAEPEPSKTEENH